MPTPRTKKPRYLPRDLITGPLLLFVMSEAEYQAAIAGIQVAPHACNKWLDDDALACVHTFKKPSGGVLCIVALRTPSADDTMIDVAARLVHEAVHVFQSYVEYIGEQTPSKEFEAYSIQQISATLMQAYVDKHI